MATPKLSKLKPIVVLRYISDAIDKTARLAFEWGYKACERGESIDLAREKLERLLDENE